MATIERIEDDEKKSEVTEAILRQLPEWFGIEEAIEQYIQGVRGKAFYALFAEEQAIGFASVVFHNEYTAEIYVMGILKKYHSRNLGTQLIETVEKRLNQDGFKFLMVKTLSPSHPDAHYAKTRQFYTKVGFYPLEEIKAIWGERNPCLIMVKTV